MSQEKINAPLWAHQVKAIEWSQTIPSLALFWEVGTGKTRAAINIMRHRYAANGRLMKTLILAPKIVLTNWKRELEAYSRIHPRDIVILTGTGAKKKSTFLQAVQDGYELKKDKIIITNYETLENDEIFTAINDWGPEILVPDEGHRLKNPEGKRAKKVITIADRSKHKYILTGTPILNTPADIFNIYRVLDGGATFGKNFWKFRSVWFEDENAGFAGRQGYFPKYVARPETYPEFNAMIYKKASRALKKECLDLPPFIRKEVFVEMSPEQKRLYNEMKKEYIAYIDDITKTETPRAVIAQLAVTKALRLMQIVTGYAKAESGEIHHIEDNPRIKALGELLETLTPNHKVIVWSVFHENYDQISKLCQKLGIDYGELHGKVSQKDREKAIDRFNNDPTCRVLIANQAAGGIGINLVSSDVSIFYSKNFSLEQDIQAEGRNYRGGSEVHQKVTRIDIVAEDTIDELISQALSNKQNIAEKILDWKNKL